MESYNLKTDNGCGEVRAVRFAPQGGVAEYNIMIRTSLRGSFSQQLESIRRSFDEAVGVLGCDGAEVMFGRWFLSDAVNQVPELPERFCGRDFLLYGFCAAHMAARSSHEVKLF